MSLLWLTAKMTEEQHAAIARVRALPTAEGSDDDIEPHALRALLAEHNIVQHPKEEDPSFGPVEHEVNFEGDYTTHHPSEVLHTSQPTMQKSSLEFHLRNDHTKMLKSDGNGFHAPENEDDKYHPITYSHGDHWNAPNWIDDGHHRILAFRMLGKPVTAESGWTDRCDCPTAVRA